MKQTLLAFFFLCFCAVAFCQNQTQDEKSHENAKKWQQLPESKKQELRKRFQELNSMTPEQRRQFESNAETFRNLPESRKEQLRKRFQFFQSLSKEQRVAAKRFIGFYLSLPPGRKAVLRRRLVLLRAMPEEKRELFLNQSPFWNRLDEKQKEQFRSFLFHPDAPVFPRRRPFRLRRTL